MRADPAGVMSRVLVCRPSCGKNLPTHGSSPGHTHRTHTRHRARSGVAPPITASLVSAVSTTK
eukprot:4903206-Prymnesium_polylepis.1